MSKIKYLLITIMTFMFLSSVAYADGHGIAKSGTINFVIGWYFDLVDIAPQAEGWAVGGGSAKGALFNVNGSGPLHEGRALCAAVSMVTPNGATNKGNCYFGDQDGDRIYTSFTGDLGKGAGINNIIGGSGKYAGITGSGPWECDWPGPADNGAFNCRNSLTYEIK
jgi:hypothetical protein